MINAGQAGYGTGTLVLTLPLSGNYSTTDLLEQPFSAASPSVSWRVSGDGVTLGPLYDSLLVSFGTVPNDTNTGTPAQVSASGDTALVEGRVIAPASVLVETTDIVRDTVVQGQEGIQTTIQLINSGGSVAELTTLSQIFRDSLGQDVSSEWVQAGSIPSLPFFINAAETLTVNRTFNLTTTATEGLIRVSTRSVYQDTLFAQFSGDSTYLIWTVL